MNGTENLFSSENNQADLNYFIRLHEGRPTGIPDHPADKWDQRADAWERDYKGTKKLKTEDRVQVTADFLLSRGLLGPDCDVADIGCGPGRFAALFGKTARSVTGFDISEKMVRYGKEYVKKQGVDNVSFRVCDFQTLDVEKEGLAGKFDLVFCSLTPAIHGMNGLEKILRMSRAHCCYISHLYRMNQLEHRILREVFHREPRNTPWSGRWFYTTFNILFLMGYYPEVSYYKRHQERLIQPGEDYVTIFMEHMLPSGECTRENEERVTRWLRENTDADGRIMEINDTCYGRLLWDVRDKTERPDYRLEK